MTNKPQDKFNKTVDLYANLLFLKLELSATTYSVKHACMFLQQGYFGAVGALMELLKTTEDP